jgi:hypothetical protein
MISNWYITAKRKEKIPDSFYGNADKEEFKEEDTDQNELKMGIEIELEHTKDRNLAKKIALDHLSEFKNYYTLLKRMEEKGKKSLSSFLFNNLFNKYATKSFYVEGYNPKRELKTIEDICFYLLDNIGKKLVSILSPEEHKYWIDNGITGDFFAPDSPYHDEPVGIINNYVKAFPINKIQWLITETKKTLQSINLKIGNIIIENFKYDGMEDKIRVIRWVIVSNPHILEKHANPLCPNFSNSNAYLFIKLILNKKNISGDKDYFLSAQYTLNKINNELSNESMVNKALRDLGYSSDGIESIINSVMKKLLLVKEVSQLAVNH